MSNLAPRQSEESWAGSNAAKGEGLSRLSLIVIARNEEASIGRCLRSAGFADELVVVENGSSDKTADIARRLNAKVISTPDWRGFGIQKNRALAAATGDWVLSLDADEWIEDDLAAEIKSAIGASNGIDGYEIPRRSRFCGHVVRYCGWQPDRVLRLFRRDKARFTNDTVHERVKLSGRLGRLTAPIEHESITDLDDAHDKVARYSAAAAAQLIEKGARGSVGKAFFHSVWAFLYTYLLQRGFLDGSVGVMVATYKASYTYQKWARVAMAASRRQPQR
jgi:glycosyltransferase involved in cell wall biosynthesis